MQTRHYRGLLAAVVVLIVYGSLFPFHFAAVPDYKDFWSVPRGRGGFLDIILNLFLYTPVGFLAFHSQRTASRRRGLVVAAVAGFLMSTAVELIQGFDLPRDSSASDILCNSIGTLGGAVFAAAWHRSFERNGFWSSHAAWSRPAFLLVFWAIYQLYPLVPHVRMLPVRQNLAGVMHHWSTFDAVLFAVDWLVALVLARESLHARHASLVTLLVLVAPLKAILVERELTASELAGAGLAVVLFLLSLRAPDRLIRLLPCVLVVFVIARELWPLHPAPAHPFNWIPFAATLGAQSEAGLLALARKAFVYGSAIWAFSEAGQPVWPTTTVLSLLIFTLEWLQRFFAGHVPDITDVIVVVLMGAALAFLPHGNVPGRST